MFAISFVGYSSKVHETDNRKNSNQIGELVGGVIDDRSHQGILQAFAWFLEHSERTRPRTRHSEGNVIRMLAEFSLRHLIGVLEGTDIVPSFPVIDAFDAHELPQLSEVAQDRCLFEVRGPPPLVPDRRKI